MTGGYPRTVDLFRKLMGILGVLCLVLALVTIVSPGRALWLVNGVAGWFTENAVAPSIDQIPVSHWWNDVHPAKTPAPEGAVVLPDHVMFLSDSVGLMVLLGAIGILMFVAPRKHAALTPYWLAGVVVPGLMGLGFYLWSAPYLANLLVAIVDLPVAVAVAVFWLRARPDLERDEEAPAAE